MKLLRIMLKNFKLLVRAKASAFTVLIGPLLIILLVGLVFSTKASYELSIGYYTPTHNNMTASFVDSLKQSKFFVQEFDDEQSCVKKIEQGIIHTCIIFPENFQVSMSNESRSELRFLVDYSRINIVYKVIDSVSGILDIESKELSYSLTASLLSRINSTVKDLSREMALVDGINLKLNAVLSDVQKAKTSSSTMTFSIGQVSLSTLNSDLVLLNETYAALQEKGIELINMSDEFIDSLRQHGENVSTIRDDFNELKGDLLDLYNLTPEKIQNLNLSLSILANSLSKAESDLNKSQQLNKDVQAKLDSIKTAVAGVQTSLSDLKKELDKTKKNLESISITKAETIVSPVNTKIEPIMLETSKLTFTFPFLLMLVIMFIALLLSSTLVIFEKSSKSFFRNHITPTKQEFFVITTFLTSFIIIIIQTAIILGLANYFMQIPLLKNALCTGVLILLATAFFIVLGMAIGYLFSTQEGAIMASIILGSIFMFLSNLVIPLESIAPGLAKLIKYNPYVLASELLRKSLLFNVNIIQEALLTLIILGGAAIIIFIIIIIAISMKNRKRIKAPKETIVIAGEKNSPSEKETQQKIIHELKIDDKKAASREDLLNLLSNMTKAEFEDQVTKFENKIADWVDEELGDKHLAAKLRKAGSRKEMLKVLGEGVKADEKKEDSEDEQQQ
jgi:ABC-type polysaccharide/polyol phosphate export permease